MYLRDITYGTNSEFGFDYLRDNMAYDVEDMVQQKGHNFAIVDEIDSILIDEARTPLIISGPAPIHPQYSELQPATSKLVKRQESYAKLFLMMQKNFYPKKIMKKHHLNFIKYSKECLKTNSL